MDECFEADLQHLGGYRCRLTIRADGVGLYVAYRLLSPHGLPLRIKDQEFLCRQLDAFTDDIAAFRTPPLPPGWDFV